MYTATSYKTWYHVYNRFLICLSDVVSVRVNSSKLEIIFSSGTITNYQFADYKEAENELTEIKNAIFAEKTNGK